MSKNHVFNKIGGVVYLFNPKNMRWINEEHCVVPRTCFLKNQSPTFVSSKSND